MFSTLRNRFGIPGVISVIALVFAMFGGAYAASNSSNAGKASAKAKAGPRGKTGKTGPAGPAGAKGDNGAPGANGSNGTPGATGASVTSSVATPEVAHCLAGGSKFVAGASTTYACNGTAGPRGAAGSPWTAEGTLPEGATETGVWGMQFPAPEGNLNLPISFSIPLATAPQVIYLHEGEASTAGCPGLVGETPTAESGKLCVYTTIFSEATNLGFAHPVTGGFEPGAGTTGTVFKTQCAAFCVIGGTWAVTG